MSRKRKNIAEELGKITNRYKKGRALSFEDRLWITDWLKHEQKKAAKELDFLSSMPTDLLREILRGQTTSGLPKTLSLINKTLKKNVDTIFSEALQNGKDADCDFLTDTGKGCRFIGQDSPIYPVCHKYCLPGILDRLPAGSGA